MLVCASLVGCREDEEKAALQREIEALRAEKAKKEARVKALNEQLENEAAEKVKALKDLDAAKRENAPLLEKVEASEQRVREVEEMIKEVKKLE